MGLKEIIKKDLGLTQKKLAEEIGVFENTINNWCTGKPISQRGMEKLVNYYKSKNLDPSRLIKYLLSTFGLSQEERVVTDKSNRLTYRNSFDPGIVGLKGIKEDKGWIEFNGLGAREVYNKAIKKLAEYEDKEERGTLSKLPALYFFPAGTGGINLDRWQIVYNYRGCILVTPCIYDREVALAQFNLEQEKANGSIYSI